VSNEVLLEFSGASAQVRDALIKNGAIGYRLVSSAGLAFGPIVSFRTHIEE